MVSGLYAILHANWHGYTPTDLVFPFFLFIVGTSIVFAYKNKALWNSSFVLVTAGWANLILALIYYLTDVKGIKFGSIFRYAGANAIVLYFLSSFVSKMMGLITIGETTLHGWLFDTIYTRNFMPLQLSSLVYALTVVGFYMLLAHILYQRKIFFKV